MKAIIFSLALALPLTGSADVLFSQPDSTTNNPNGVPSDAFSTNGGQFWRQSIGDDFTLSTNSSVQQITFFGSSEAFNSPSLSNFSSFQIRIMDTGFNTVFNASASTASLTPTLTGAGNGLGGPEYGFTLGTGFALAAGTYILNIGTVNVSAGGDGFFWSQSGAVGSSIYVNKSTNGTSWNGWQTSTTSPNQAFTLSGVASVPEPQAVIVFSIGTLALVRRGNSRKSSL